MRRFALLLPFLLACGPSEQPAADSAAASTVSAALLTEADVSGTWTGTSSMEGSDSVVARWTQICAAGTCKGTAEGQPDTITSTYRLDADSSMGTSSPYPLPEAKGAMVVDRWVARVSGGTVTGTQSTHLADKPDSVLMRSRFTGSKAP